MKQFGRKTIKEAERLGYEYDRTNSSRFDVYVHPNAGEIAINPGMDEAASRSCIRTMQKAVGMFERQAGRNATAIKDRRARHEELNAERLAAERRDIEKQRATYLARIGAADFTQVDRADLARIEARLTEIRQLEALMTDVPASAEHSGRGRARHCAGATR